MPPQEKYRQRIRDIRPFSRPNPDGSRSTVLLEQADNYAYPTLFPVNPNNPEAGWIELKGDEALKEAIERGEVFEFGSEKEAMKFAEGSWKHLEEKPTSKSIDDIIQNSNIAEAITQAVSTKSKSPEKSISDLSIPMSERYGDPVDIRIGKTISKGIPMDMSALRDAMTGILTSSRGEKLGSQKELAEQSLGELLGMTAGFNRRREGKRFIKRILDKYNLMDRPGGLVAYRTEEGYPAGPSGILGGYFREGIKGETPDTIAIFGDKSSMESRHPLRSLIHESIHAGAKEGTPIKEMAHTKMHQKKFGKAEKEITQYNWVEDLLRSAMMRKKEDQYQLPKGFIK